jgi:hypothetical protein
VLASAETIERVIAVSSAEITAVGRSCGSVSMA